MTILLLCSVPLRCKRILIMGLSGQTNQSPSKVPLQILGFALVLSSLGFWVGWFLPSRVSMQWAVSLCLGLGVAWANSSFDPRQDSRAHRIWQYAAPWVVGGMSFVVAPFGLFIGAIAGSMVAGFWLSISFSAIVAVTLLLMGGLFYFSFYSLQEYRDYKETLKAEGCLEEVEQLEKKNLDRNLGSAGLSLVWSFFQGIALAGVLALGAWTLPLWGLLAAVVWNLLLVGTVMLFHLGVRGQMKRGNRFLLLVSAISGGAFLGLFLSTL